MQAIEFGPEISPDDEAEEIEVAWSDGRTDTVPGPASDDYGAHEVANLGTYTDGLGVGGSASRLCRLKRDLWAASDGAFEEMASSRIWRGPQVAVLKGWLLEAIDSQDHFADLSAFVACWLAGHVERDADVDAAVVAGLLPDPAGPESKPEAPGDISWTGVMMFLNDDRRLLARSEKALAAALTAQVPATRQLFDGRSSSVAELRRRLAEWDKLA